MWVVDDDGDAGVDYASIQAVAGVDRVYPTCTSICVNLCAGSKRDFNAMQKTDRYQSAFLSQSRISEVVTSF